MIFLKTDEEIELMRESNMLVAKTLGELAKIIKPGVTSLELDKVAETFIKDNKGYPGFLNYNGFPNSICTSVNVVHGIPNDKPLEDGDIISVDCGVLLNGYYGDSAYTFEVGNVKQEIKDLLRVTKESLYKGIEMAVESNRIGDIGFAVQSYCEKHGYSVVREMVGHGVGKSLHESPEVPNYGRRGNGPKLRAGMVIAIEPMINLGKRNIVLESDNWTISTVDKSPSAHFEHTVAITKNGADILSSFKFTEEVLTLQSKK